MKVSPLKRLRACQKLVVERERPTKGIFKISKEAVARRFVVASAREGTGGPLGDDVWR
jgi:hypothetical protein